MQKLHYVLLLQIVTNHIQALAMLWYQLWQLFIEKCYHWDIQSVIDTINEVLVGFKALGSQTEFHLYYKAAPLPGIGPAVFSLDLAANKVS